MVIDFQPPDLDHGNTLLNLSKSIGAWAPQSASAYACYDLGLLMESSPDTVRFPAMSIFCAGERFGEMDKAITESVPDVVVELASTADRRSLYPDRAEQYLSWGVSAVWVIDPQEQQLLSHRQNESLELFDATGTFVAEPWLKGFSLVVSDLFIEPEWWTRP